MQAVSRPQLRCDYPASELVEAAADALEGDRAALATLQRDAGVESPLDVDLRLAGEHPFLVPFVAHLVNCVKPAADRDSAGAPGAQLRKP